MIGFTRDERGVVAIEAAIILPFTSLLFLGAIVIGAAEIATMSLHTGTQNAANLASTKSITQADAFAAVCGVMPINCNLIAVTFNAGSPGGVGTVTSSMPIDLSMIPFANLGTINVSATSNFVVKP